METHIRIVDTGDGSHSLRNDALNENYHSWHGAIEESKYVFLKMGLSKALESFKQINILEVGYGTGLNASLALNFCIENSIPATYFGTETYPIPTSIMKNLNYPSFFNEGENYIFQILIDAEWNNIIEFNDSVKAVKKLESFQDLEKESLLAPINLIFYDAFAPEKQPEMWLPSIWDKCFELLESGGVFVTYCAKGQFKRDLKASGFIIESLAGPPGKREMVRAIKP
ncbi:MAG TPA: tRNA (5-methylaminomethyl-2-thiouridine)(34)-methyltransferase MnmD [Bacteroidia bacterium]